MKIMSRFLLAGAGLAFSTGAALADGELHIYNWGNYTSPEMIAKFEKTYNVKVTLDDYDSNDQMLAKIKAGGSGYDIVVPSSFVIPQMIKDGLLAKTEPDQIRPDGQLQECPAGIQECLLGRRPPLHRALAVGHDRRFGQYRRL
jgi:spermidine/putrescine transport system substrate-binding protein